MFTKQGGTEEVFKGFRGSFCKWAFAWPSIRLKYSNRTVMYSDSAVMVSLSENTATVCSVLSATM